MAGLSLHLPAADTAEEARKTYDSALAALIVELGGYFNHRATEEFGPDWFAKLMGSGHSFDEQKHWVSPFDPSFLFGEVLNYVYSPLRSYLPQEQQYMFSYKKARHVRNSWAHNFGEFKLIKLRNDLEHFKNVALGINLEVGKALQGVTSRINSILNGTYSPEKEPEKILPASAEDVPTQAKQAIHREEEHRKTIEREQTETLTRQTRPRIGGRWVGPKPQRALRVIEKLNDVVDRQTNVSIKSELGEHASAEISLWLAPKPLGDLFVDKDGAVLGYIHGEPYLLGYLGQKPERDRAEIEGFVLPASYSYEDGDIREEGSNRLLSETVAEETGQLRAVIGKAVNPLDELKITTHGDLFSYTEDGPVKIIRVPSKLWFP